MIYFLLRPWALTYGLSVPLNGSNIKALIWPLNISALPPPEVMLLRNTTSVVSYLQTQTRQKCARTIGKTRTLQSSHHFDAHYMV